MSLFLHLVAELLRERPGVQVAELRVDDVVIAGGFGGGMLRLVARPDRDDLLQATCPAPDLPDFELSEAAWLDAGVDTGHRVFDRSFQLSGHARSELLYHFSAEVRALALELEPAPHVSVRGGVFRPQVLRTNQHAAVRFLERAFDLRAALSRDRWQALEERGFTPAETGLWVGEGVEIVAGDGLTRVVVRGSFPLTCVLAEAPPLNRRVETHNPVADRLVQVSGPPDRVRELLADEAFFGPLLELVHGHPGSTLYPTALSLVVARLSEAAPLEELARAQRFAAALSG